MEPTGVAQPKRWTEGLTGYHWLVLAVASFGWLFDTMDQWLFVFARQPALQDLLGAGTSDATVGYYSNIVQMWFILGWATGGFLFGMIGDRLGRTRTMAITVLIYAGFTGLSGLAQTWEQFALIRFLTGLGIGGEFAAGAALIAETFPAHSRPTALGIMQASSALGNMLASGINYVIAPAMGWRWVFAVGVLPALLVFVIRLFVKEPQKWNEARIAGQKLGSMLELFGHKEWRRHTFIGIGLAAVGVIGFWGINTFSPDLLRGILNPTKDPALKAITDKQVSLAVMAQNAGAFFGVLSWAWLAQRIGRRSTFALTFLACLIVVPATFQLTKSYTHALILFPMMGFCITALFGGFAIYFPELFPTRLRATGTGFCYNVARYLAAAGIFLSASLRESYGIANSATMVAGIFVVGFLVLKFAPETKGKPLPE
jgi:MFS family permease